MRRAFAELLHESTILSFLSFNKEELTCRSGRHPPNAFERFPTVVYPVEANTRLQTHHRNICYAEPEDVSIMVIATN